MKNRYAAYDIMDGMERIVSRPLTPVCNERPYETGLFDPKSYPLIFSFIVRQSVEGWEYKPAADMLCRKLRYLLDTTRHILDSSCFCISSSGSKEYWQDESAELGVFGVPVLYRNAVRIEFGMTFSGMRSRDALRFLSMLEFALAGPPQGKRYYCTLDVQIRKAHSLDFVTFSSQLTPEMMMRAARDAVYREMKYVTGGSSHSYNQIMLFCLAAGNDTFGEAAVKRSLMEKYVQRT